MLKKYSPIATLEKFSEGTAKSLSQLSGHVAVICDTDEVANMFAESCASLHAEGSIFAPLSIETSATAPRQSPLQTMGTIICAVTSSCHRTVVYKGRNNNFARRFHFKGARRRIQNSTHQHFRRRGNGDIPNGISLVLYSFNRFRIGNTNRHCAAHFLWHG